MNFANAFQKIGLTLAAIIFSCAALFYAINPAQADNPSATNSTGKIMMSESGFVMNGNPMYHILVWDTETGKSKLHVYDEGKIINANYQLPSSPLY
jgi:hypothetical protein